MPKVTDLRRALDKTEIIYLEKKITEIKLLIKNYKDALKTTIHYRQLRKGRWFFIIAKDDGNPLLGLGDDGHDDSNWSSWTNDPDQGPRGVSGEDELALMTDGVNELDLAFEIYYPSVNRTHTECEGLDEQKKAVVTEVEEQYKNKIKEFLNPSNGDETVKQGSTAKKNFFGDCNGKIQCSVPPTLTESVDRKELQPIPCDTPWAGMLDSCGGKATNASVTSCCPYESEKSSAYCPSANLIRARSILTNFIGLHPRLNVMVNGRSRPIRRSRGLNFCFIITNAEDNGSMRRLADQKLGVTNNDLSLVTQRKKRALVDSDPAVIVSKRNRKRRSLSNLMEYWLSGGALTPTYTLSKLKDLKTVEETSISELKDQLKTDEATLLKVANSANGSILSKEICALGDQLSAELVLAKLVEKQDTEFDRMEVMISSCEMGNVPPAISQATIEKMCKAGSQSTVCLGLLVRSMTTCELHSINMLEDRVTIVMTLSQPIPIDEPITMYNVGTLPVYGESRIVANRVTAKPPVSLTTVGDEKKAMAAKLVKILTSRRRRSIPQEHRHYLLRRILLPKMAAVKGDIMSQDHDVSIMTFDKCTNRGRLQLCDVTNKKTV